jgi:hypothetical protein
MLCMPMPCRVRFKCELIATCQLFPTRLLTSVDEYKWYWHQMIYFPETINTISMRIQCYRHIHLFLLKLCTLTYSVHAGILKPWRGRLPGLPAVFSFYHVFSLPLSGSNWRSLFPPRGSGPPFPKMAPPFTGSAHTPLPGSGTPTVNGHYFLTINDSNIKVDFPLKTYSSMLTAIVDTIAKCSCRCSTETGLKATWQPLTEYAHFFPSYRWIVVCQFQDWENPVDPSFQKDCSIDSYFLPQLILMRRSF